MKLAEKLWRGLKNQCEFYLISIWGNGIMLPFLKRQFQKLPKLFYARSQAAENTQRNRPDHFAGGANFDLSDGYRDLAAVFFVRRSNLRRRTTDHDYRTGGVAGLPDSDDYRRLIVCHRRRGYW